MRDNDFINFIIDEISTYDYLIMFYTPKNSNYRSFTIKEFQLEVYYPFSYKPRGDTNFIVCNGSRLYISDILFEIFIKHLLKLKDNLLKLFTSIDPDIMLRSKEDFIERLIEFDVIKDGVLDRISLDSLKEYYDR